MVHIGDGNLEKFLCLSCDKQNAIINAAFTAFGRNGYKKASVNDIASVAGVSKAMMFYYFGSKKSMYIYMVELCGGMILSEVEKNLDKDVTDFFNRIKMISQIKMSVFKKHPSALLFIKSAYYETDPQVVDEIKNYMADRENLSIGLVFDNIDLSRFKDDVDPSLLLRFILWASEGFASNISEEDAVRHADMFADDFYKCLDFMKSNFYKTEFL